MKAYQPVGFVVECEKKQALVGSPISSTCIFLYISNSCSGTSSGIATAGLTSNSSGSKLGTWFFNVARRLKKRKFKEQLYIILMLSLPFPLAIPPTGNRNECDTLLFS